MNIYLVLVFICLQFEASFGVIYPQSLQKLEAKYSCDPLSSNSFYVNDITDAIIKSENIINHGLVSEKVIQRLRVASLFSGSISFWSTYKLYKLWRNHGRHAKRHEIHFECNSEVSQLVESMSTSSLYKNEKLDSAHTSKLSMAFQSKLFFTIFGIIQSLVKRVSQVPFRKRDYCSTDDKDELKLDHTEIRSDSHSIAADHSEDIQRMSADIAHWKKVSFFSVVLTALTICTERNVDYLTEEVFEKLQQRYKSDK